jgi:uncharacterized delta-60 repeat protein
MMSIAAQPGDTLWVRRFNGLRDRDDKPTGILCDRQGNVIVTGYTYAPETDFNFLVIKYDSLGNLLWYRNYGSSFNSEDRVWAAALDTAGNIYVTGGTIADPAHNWDYQTIKYSPAGETAWLRRYDSPFHGEDKPRAIGVDDSGNVYVTGESRGRDHDWDFLTIRYNSKGDTVWTRRYDGSYHHDDLAGALAIDRQGNVIVAGKSADEYRTPEIAVVKYDPGGRPRWIQRLQGTGSSPNWPTRMKLDARGDCYVCGAVSNAGASYDYVLGKCSPDGKLLWSRTYDGPGHRIDIANALDFDAQGNILVTGQSMGTQSFSDYATIKYTPTGDTLWVRRYDGPVHGEDRAQAVAVDENDMVYVTGGSVKARPYEGYLTVACNAQGDSLWTRDWPSLGSGDSRAVAATIASGRRLIVTGYWLNQNGNFDVVTIAYRR